MGITVLHAQSVTIHLPTITSPGDSLIIPATITETDNFDFVQSMVFIINFDPDVLEYIDVSFPNPDFPDYNWTTVNPQPGDLRLLWFHTYAPGTQVTPPEILFEIEFEYFGGCSPLIWESIAIAIYGGNLENITAIDGSVGCTSQNNLWEGTIDENWHNPGNWSLGTIPQGDNAEIPYNGSFDSPVIYGTAETDSLIIHTNASLTIAPGGNLTTTNFSINDGTLIIQSDSTGISGSFIELIGMGGTGSVEFDRHITNSSPVGEPSAQHFLSSPVDGFATDFIPDYNVNVWNEDIGYWQTIQGMEPCTPASPPVTINPMEGWSIKLDPDYITNCGFGTGEVIEMQGYEFNSGAYSIPFSFSPGLLMSGWNLLGNPYPCAIDPNLFFWPENINQSIYVWDGRLNNSFTWAGGVGIQSIPPTQGFFVNAFGDGTFLLTGDERIHDSETAWFKDEIDNLLTLKASNVENDYYDLTHIRFLEEATSGFDIVWDAYKMMSNTPGVPQIYTSTSSNSLSINTLQFTAMVPLAFFSEESGNFEIQAIETSEFEFLVLEDIFTGEQVDLLSDVYIFEYTGGDDPDRFLIHFVQVGIDDKYQDNIRIFSDNRNIIISSNNQLNGEIVIYDIVGKEITRTPFNSGKNVIPGLQKNVLYIVDVTTTNNKITKKIFIK